MLNVVVCGRRDAAEGDVDTRIPLKDSVCIPLGEERNKIMQEDSDAMGN